MFTVITCTIFWSVITCKESRFFLFCLYWLMIIMTSLLTKVTLKIAGSLTGKAIMKPSELCLLTAALSSQSAVRLVGGLQTTTTPTRAQLHRPIDQKQQISSLHTQCYNVHHHLQVPVQAAYPHKAFCELILKKHFYFRPGLLHDLPTSWLNTVLKADHIHKWPGF